MNKFNQLRLTLAFTVIAVVTLVGVGIARYGSFKNGIAALSGEALVVDERSKDFGRAASNENVIVSFRLTNVSSGPIEIVGSRMSCTCMISDKPLPIIIEPGLVQEMKISVRPPASPIQFSQTIVLYTDIPNQREIRLRITGRVADRQGTPTVQISR